MKYPLYISIAFVSAQVDSNSVHTVIAGQGRPANEEELRWQRVHEHGTGQHNIPLSKSDDDPNGIKIESIPKKPYGSIDIEAVRMRENDQGQQEIVEDYGIQRSSSSCPEVCSCGIYENAKKTIECKGRKALITKIPNAIPSNAIRVDLSDNEIQSIAKEDLAALNEVEWFNFSSNTMTNIDERLRAFHSIINTEWLDLSYNLLYRVHLSKLRHLTFLNITHNRFNEIPSFKDESGHFLPIQHINLAYNPFTTISTDTFPPTLQHLDLSCLRMRSFPSEALNTAAQLKRLIIKGCSGHETSRLAVIERGAFSNSQLEVLDLRGNQIFSIPDKLPISIRHLNLGFNQLTNLQETCVDPDHLYNRAATAGSHHEAGSKLKSLINLKTIDFTHNRMTHICIDDLINLNDLERLNISYNKIDSIPINAFSFAPNLQTLDLTSNKMQIFNMENMAALKWLSVAKNAIYTLVDPRTYPNLVEFDSSYNPYKCDCHLKKFVEFMKNPRAITVVGQNSKEYHQRYQCEIPLRLRKLPIHQLKMEDLICENLEEDDKLPMSAILAPISIILILAIVIGVVFCASKNRRTRNKMKEFGGRHVKLGHDEHVVASGGANAKNIIKNDAAILCHVNSQKWVTDIMLPTLKQKPQQSKLRCDKLYIDVFTIKSQVKNEKLRRCVEQNRRVVIIITEEFASSDACLFCLQAIYDQTRRHRKDGIVLVVLDPIPWASMPHPLKLLMAEKTFIQYPVEDVGRQTFYFWDALRASVYADQLDQVPDTDEGMGKTTQLIQNDDKSEKEYDQGDHVDDIYNGIDLMKKAIIEKSQEKTVVTNLTKVAEVNPSQIKQIGATMSKLPMAIEIENPYRDAQILHEMAKATSKDEVLEIHEDLEDLYQKRHTWQRPSIPDETTIWTGQKFALPKGDDAQSVYSKDNNGIPKNPLTQVHPGSLPNPTFHQPNAGNTFDSRNNSNGRLISANMPDPDTVYATADENHRAETGPY